MTIFDGQDLTSHVIGQYMTSRERFQIVSGGSEVTIQFQSDPVDSSFILSQGFLIHYHGESLPLRKKLKSLRSVIKFSAIVITTRSRLCTQLFDSFYSSLT